MAGFLDRLVAHHKKNKVRSANFDFFKACMAGAAMITMADGHADRREDASIRAMFKSLEEFRTFGSRQGQEVYDGFIEALEQDPEKGRKKALDAIDPVKADPEWAALLVAVCATVSAADGAVAESESAVIEQICTELDLDPSAIKSYEIDFTSELYD